MFPPSISNRYNTSPVLSNVLEHRLREIKMLQGRVAPAPSIIGEGRVGWAEIGGSDHNGTWQAPLAVIYTPYLITSPTA